MYIEYQLFGIPLNTAIVHATIGKYYTGSWIEVAIDLFPQGCIHIHVVHWNHRNIIINI